MVATVTKMPTTIGIASVKRVIWILVFMLICSFDSKFRCLTPEINSSVPGKLVDLVQFLGTKSRLLERAERVVQLLDVASADQSRSYAVIAEHPSYRHLGQRLPSLLCDRRQPANVVQILLRQEILLEILPVDGAPRRRTTADVLV